MYQFHFFDARGGVPSLDFFDCADDGAATRLGREQLALHPTCLGVDIFDGDRQVVRLLGGRPTAPGAGMGAGTGVGLSGMSPSGAAPPAATPPAVQTVGTDR